MTTSPKGFRMATDDHRRAISPRTPNMADMELRVIKTLAPKARGAKSLAAKFGAPLICVRHRLDRTGMRRLTTVELVVSETAIRRRPGPTVDIALRPKERELQARVKAAGGKWHPEQAVWSMRRSVAIALGLKKRIVSRVP
jgi:hypothetical protein